MADITLRPATGDDIAFVMATERMPGYDAYIGKSGEDKHRSRLADPDSAYLIGVDDTGNPAGFVIVWHLDDPGGNVLIKRVAVSLPEKGTGSALMRLAIDWAYNETAAHRL